MTSMRRLTLATLILFSLGSLGCVFDAGYRHHHGHSKHQHCD